MGEQSTLCSEVGAAETEDPFENAEESFEDAYFGDISDDESDLNDIELEIEEFLAASNHSALSDVESSSNVTSEEIGWWPPCLFHIPVLTYEDYTERVLPASRKLTAPLNMAADEIQKYRYSDSHFADNHGQCSNIEKTVSEPTLLDEVPDKPPKSNIFCDTHICCGKVLAAWEKSETSHQLVDPSAHNTERSISPIFSESEKSEESPSLLEAVQDVPHSKSRCGKKISQETAAREPEYRQINLSSKNIGDARGRPPSADELVPPQQYMESCKFFVDLREPSRPRAVQASKRYSSTESLSKSSGDERGKRQSPNQLLPSPQKTKHCRFFVDLQEPLSTRPLCPSVIASEEHFSEFASTRKKNIESSHVDHKKNELSSAANRLLTDLLSRLSETNLENISALEELMLALNQCVNTHTQNSYIGTSSVGKGDPHLVDGSPSNNETIKDRESSPRKRWDLQNPSELAVSFKRLWEKRELSQESSNVQDSPPIEIAIPEAMHDLPGPKADDQQRAKVEQNVQQVQSLAQKVPRPSRIPVRRFGKLPKKEDKNRYQRLRYDEPGSKIPKLIRKRGDKILSR